MASRQYIGSRGYWREVKEPERRNMTICMAAACDEYTSDPKIVTCTDWKISGTLGSAQTMLKNRPVGIGWRCLTAGTDRDILAVMSLLHAQFNAHHFPEGQPQQKHVDETKIKKLIERALFQRKRDKAEQLIRGKFAIPYDEFLATGKVRLPDDSFRSAMTEVELTEIDAEFIIVGFCEGTYATLLKTNHKCDVSIFEDFVTIGEGGYLAQAMLMYRAQSHTLSFGQTVYNVYEAKRFAEGAPTVGPDTTIAILHKDGHTDLLVNIMPHLQNLYDSFGPHKVPEDLTIDAKFVESLGKTNPEVPGASVEQSS